jgi:hypothetical protein
VEEQLIAHGGFCEVRGIKQFKVSTELDREIVKKQYVIKHLSPKLIGKHRQLAIGAKDLVWEGFVLSSLNHENILEVKGYASSGVSGYASTGRVDGFFLVLPRLDKTLHKQLHEWRVEVKRQQRRLLRCDSNVGGHGDDTTSDEPARKSSHHNNRLCLSEQSPTGVLDYEDVANDLSG